MDKLWSLDNSINNIIKFNAKICLDFMKEMLSNVIIIIIIMSMLMG